MSLPTRLHFLAHNITPTTPSPSSDTETDCAICKEDYNTTTGHPAVTFSNTTSCNHIFCEPCIVAWLSAKGTNTCPLCRRELFVLDDGEGEVEYEGDREFETFGEEDEDDGDVEYYFAGGGVWDVEEGEDEDEEDDDEFPFEEEEEWEGEEGGDGLEDIPLSYLYRNSLLPLQTTPLETTALLQTIFHKIWNLSSTYRTAVTQAVEQAKRDDKPLPNWDHASFSRHLPTTTTMVASLVEAVRAHTGTDLSGWRGC
ncbi:uncharacterized protein J4E79_009651 [Alternaria viburni]|uniref:uncharacterized protein n=1 Tax=Alternaria viburni TaxID=566460 RepID=UPI0020C4EA3D|nr:uncharacterized protein J4E79_009651 [Alternaria viburni]KAI4649805.1 hypothetical protein J4E79_009651 [Alternaria viburni]